MPIYNRFFRDASGKLIPAGLREVGAFFDIEVHVPPPIAQILTNQGKPLPSPVRGVAIVDTGATMTCVNESILQGLGLNPIGIVLAGTASGPTPQNIYPARLVFPAEGFGIDFQGVAGVNLAGQMIPLNPPQQVIALIGRNILERWVLTWNGPGGFWTVAM